MGKGKGKGKGAVACSRSAAFFGWRACVAAGRRGALQPRMADAMRCAVPPPPACARAIPRGLCGGGGTPIQ
eukprot:936626-Prymnesium_polylepis.1